MRERTGKGGGERKERREEREERKKRERGGEREGGEREERERREREERERREERRERRGVYVYSMCVSVCVYIPDAAIAQGPGRPPHPLTSHTTPPHTNKHT